MRGFQSVLDMIELLTLYRHLIYEVAGTGILVYYEKHIADVHRNGTLYAVLKAYVATHGFPVAIKRTTDQFAFGIHYWAARVTTGYVCAVDETYRQFAIFICILAVIFGAV